MSTPSSFSCAAEDRERSGNLGILIILGALTAFTPFAIDMYLAGFPSIAKSFETGVDKVQWSLASFLIGMAVGQFFYGPLIDRYGRKKPLLAGVSVFILASVLLMVAPTVEIFILLRFVQAVGGCAGMIVSRAIVQDLYDEREAARAFSLMMMIQGVGPVLAPVLGSYLLIFSSWHAVFAFLAGLGILCLAAAWLYLPETLPAGRMRSQSFIRILKTFAIMLRKRAFLVPVLSSGCAICSIFIFISGSPFVFMTLFGLGQEAYGWLFGFNALGMVMAGQLNRFLLKRYAVRRVYLATLAFNMLAGAVLLGVASAHSLLFLIPALFFSLVTVPLNGANGVAMAMAISGRYAGSASSLIGVIHFALVGIVSVIVSLLHNGTAYPMTGMIFVCATIALLIFVWGRK